MIIIIIRWKSNIILDVKKNWLMILIDNNDDIIPNIRVAIIAVMHAIATFGSIISNILLNIYI